jgi:hypothetical protein
MCPLADFNRGEFMGILLVGALRDRFNAYVRSRRFPPLG